MTTAPAYALHALVHRLDKAADAILGAEMGLTHRRYLIHENFGAVVILHDFPWIDAGLPVDPGTPASQTFRVEDGKNRYIHEATVCTTPQCGRGRPPTAN